MLIYSDRPYMRGGRNNYVPDLYYFVFKEINKIIANKLYWNAWINMISLATVLLTKQVPRIVSIICMYIKVDKYEERAV